MKKLLLITSFILGFYGLIGQNDSYIALDTLPFIQYDADTLVFDTDTSLLNHFFQKMEKAIENGEGEINILQIGGSHIQAGTMSNTIRRDLLLANPKLISGRGFVFPYSLGPKSNNPTDYRVKKEGNFTLVRNVHKEHARPLSTTGIAAFTSDTFPEFCIIFKDSLLQFKTQRVILIGNCSPKSNIPTIWVDSSEYFPIAIDTNLGRYTYQVSFQNQFCVATNCTGDSLEEFVLNGLFLENEHRGITYHSIGVNGASVPSYLRCENFERDLDLFRPDLVIFGIGINDAFDPDFKRETFEQNYLMLIQKIKSYNPHCAFIFFTNNDSYKRVKKKFYNNTNAVAVQQTMYNLAAQTGGAVFDQYKIMGGRTSMYKWYKHNLAKYDRIHFTTEGYELMGHLFYNAFLHAQLKCKQNLQPKEVE